MTWLLARKLAPYAIIAILFAALLQTRATLHDARQTAQLEAAAALAASSAKEADWARQGRQATETYAKALASIQPVVIRSIDKVQTYAETPAGRAPCLSVDRVRSIAEDRAALFAFTPSGGAGGVSANGATSGGAQQR